jgi:hypothetical protein
MYRDPPGPNKKRTDRITGNDKELIERQLSDRRRRRKM